MMMILKYLLIIFTLLLCIGIVNGSQEKQPLSSNMKAYTEEVNQYLKLKDTKLKVMSACHDYSQFFKDGELIAVKYPKGEECLRARYSSAETKRYNYPMWVAVEPVIVETGKLLGEFKYLHISSIDIATTNIFRLSLVGRLASIKEHGDAETRRKLKRYTGRQGRVIRHNKKKCDSNSPIPRRGQTRRHLQCFDRATYPFEAGGF